MDPFAGDVQSPQSLHKYLYCQNDPVNYTDPSGRDIIGFLGGLGAMLSMEVTVGMMLEQTAFTVLKGIAIGAVLATGKQPAQMRQDGLDLMAIYGGIEKYYDLATRLYNLGSLGIAQTCQEAILAAYGVEIVECLWNVGSLAWNLANLSRALSATTTTTVIVSQTTLTYAMVCTTRNTRTMFVSFSRTTRVTCVTETVAALNSIEDVGSTLLSSVEFYLGPKIGRTTEDAVKQYQVLAAITDFCEKHPEWQLSEADSNDVMLVLTRFRKGTN